MRTDHPTPAAAAVRLKAQFHRARRLLSAQGPAVRWPLALAGIALLTFVAYQAAPSTPAGVFLGSGKAFSRDDVSLIGRAFDAKRIPFQVDSQSRVEVASDRVEEASAVLAKLGLGFRSIAEIESETNQPNLFDGPKQADLRRDLGRNRMLAERIRRLSDSGIIAAQVEVQRRTVRGGLRPVVSATALVYLETLEDRPVGFPTVQKIQDLIVAAEPDVKRDAVTVFDQTGRHYLDASDPNVSREARTRAREEELTERLLKQLDYVKGVRVTVQLAPVPVPVATPSPAPAPAEVPSPPPPPAEELASPLAVNRPLELEEPDPPAAPAPAAVKTAPTAPAPAPARPPATAEQVRVWVKVPSSYYLKSKSNHEPSADELKAALEKTERLIKRAVGLVLPPETTPAPEVFVDTVPDHQESAPVLLAAASEPRLTTTWWAIGGAAGAAGAMLLALGYRLAASRRPASRPPAADFGRFAVDAASEPGPGPGPSERVRELIRLNPEAAASVLQRWTGQGGPDS